jgi:hypothetical protein
MRLDIVWGCVKEYTWLEGIPFTQSMKQFNFFIKARPQKKTYLWPVFCFGVFDLSFTVGGTLTQGG